MRLVVVAEIDFVLEGDRVFLRNRRTTTYWIVAGILAAAILNLGVLVFYWTRSEIPRVPRRAALPPDYRGVSEQADRIQGIIKQLAAEDTQESIRRLYADGTSQYSYPGHNFPRKLDDENLLRMLSNRRCVKVILELGRAPADTRRVAHEHAFDEVMSAQRETYETCYRMHEDPTAPRNTQSLIATQEAVCTVMFATALTGDVELLMSQFVALDKFAIDHRKRWQQVIDRVGPKPSQLGERVAPDALARFNILRLVVAQRGEASALQAQEIDRIAKDHGMQQQQVKVTAWQSPVSSFDIPHRLEFVPIDESHGITVYDLWEWNAETLIAGDTAKERIVRLVRDVVFRDSAVQVE